MHYILANFLKMNTVYPHGNTDRAIKTKQSLWNKYKLCFKNTTQWFKSLKTRFLPRCHLFVFNLFFCDKKSPEPLWALGLRWRHLFRSPIMAGAQGFESRRDDAKPRKFRLCYAPRSVAALTAHRAVIHYRSSSNPCIVIPQKEEVARCATSSFCVWQPK